MRAYGYSLIEIIIVVVIIAILAMVAFPSYRAYMNSSRRADAMSGVIEIAEGVRRGELRAVDCVREALARVSRDNEALNAFIHVDEKLALEAAEAVDALVAKGEDPGLLAGVPFGVKDADSCAGLPLSHGSVLGQSKPVREKDSVHIGRLRRAGAIPIGVTAEPEFGAISWTRSRAWGVTPL